MGGTEKSGGETKILKRGEGANWVKGGGGAGTPLGTMPSIFTLFQVFKCYIFVTNFNVFTQTPTSTPSYLPLSAKHDKTFMLLHPPK